MIKLILCVPIYVIVLHVQARYNVEVTLCSETNVAGGHSWPKTARCMNSVLSKQS
jgi:hypothetical protein